MRIVSQISVFILILFFSTVTTSYSQVKVERSDEKVVISGVAYYIHQVRKGETAYSVSRAYGIKVEELVKENPPALYGLAEGQSLRIPVSSVIEADSKQVQQIVKKPRDEANFIYHTLNPGETIYFLSKLYGVSDNEIIQSNPGIDITKLSVGTEIAIPRRKFMSARQDFDVPERKFTYHKVQEGESLSSIAPIYGLTVKDLRKENRDTRFPQVGDYLRIPGTREPEAKQEGIIADLAEVPDTVVSEVVVRPTGYTSFSELSGSLNVAVLLPFYFKENSARVEIDSSRMIRGKRVYKENKRQEDWIYPGSLDFVEMYEGILLAADTLRSLGLNINLFTWDIKSDTAELSRLIGSGKLASMDLIIGPVYSHNLARVSAYAKDRGIPVVSPVPLFNNAILSGNPNLFMANPSLVVAQKALAKRIGKYPGHNFVFIHTDSLGVDEDVKRLKNLIITELTNWVPYDEIRFKEFLFFSRSMFDRDSINRLGHALSTQTGNVVIIASEDVPVISESLMDIHGLSRKFGVKVFGYPVMRELENLDPRYFFDLDIQVYSPYWIDYSMDDVRQFNSHFRLKFMTQPSELSYAWQGYDVAYYFISGIALHGRDFILTPWIHRPDLLHSEYDFVSKTSQDGFENQKLYLIHFTKEYEVIMVEEKRDQSEFQDLME